LAWPDNTTYASIKRTIDFAIELDGEFAEFILARCFPGTILYDICKDLGILVEKDPILEPEFGHLYLSECEIKRLHRECFKKFHFRARYIVSLLVRAKNPKTAVNYAIAGFGKLRTFMRTRHPK